MLFKEIISVCTENHTRSIQNAQLLIFKSGGTYSYHSFLVLNASYDTSTLKTQCVLFYPPTDQWHRLPPRKSGRLQCYSDITYRQASASAVIITTKSTNSQHEFTNKVSQRNRWIPSGAPGSLSMSVCVRKQLGACLLQIPSEANVLTGGRGNVKRQNWNKLTHWHSVMRQTGTKKYRKEEERGTPSRPKESAEKEKQ